jgi:hypothetical protein
MSRDQATGMVTDGLRSSRTTATQFVDSDFCQAHWNNILSLPFTSQRSTLDTLRR